MDDSRYASCCDKGKTFVGKAHRFGWYLCGDEDGNPISFCPFCGHDLSQPVFQTLEEALEAILASPVPVRICFDVDGLLCDDRVPAENGGGAPLPYDERGPYPWVPSLLKRLRAAGHLVIIQTARYMMRCHGNQQKAHEVGYLELRDWLRQHSIPYDELYLGKASADIYADDRGCRVESNRGITDWMKSFVPVLATTQAKRKHAHLRLRM